MSLSVVIGSAGQDGRLLCEQLRSRGDNVVRIHRAGVQGTGPTFDAVSPPVDLTEASAVRELIGTLRPDEVYYLAAHHHSSTQHREPAAELYRLSHAVHVEGYLNVLTAVAETSPRTGVFYAASSHVFGRPAASPQNEQTPLNPVNLYAVTKTAGVHLGRHFREIHGLRVCCGILYNHESPLRKADFVSQRIVSAAAARKPLTLNNLRAVVDWGYAPDFTRAMTMALAADPGEYVIATGIPHTVEDFAREAYAAMGLDYREYVQAPHGEDGGVPLVGDASKLRNATGWAPTLPFERMVRELVDHRSREA